MMLLEYAINKAGSFDTEAIRTALENAQGVKLFSDDNFTVDKETQKFKAEYLSQMCTCGGRSICIVYF